MNTKRFTLTEGQQEELRMCPHVRKVSARMVQYNADFKRHAISERARGKPPQLIWSEAGIPYHFKPKYAAERINDWRRLAEKHGTTHFEVEHRGAQGLSLQQWREKEQRYKQMNTQEKVAYLEAEVEALEYIRRHFQMPPAIHQKSHSFRRRPNTKS